jgi:hypothetical protein
MQKTSAMALILLYTAHFWNRFLSRIACFYAYAARFITEGRIPCATRPRQVTSFETALITRARQNEF